MNKTHSSTLLAAVFLSISFSATGSYAQSEKLYINPTPLDGAVVREPTQDGLMIPIDTTEHQSADERALLDSIVVPQPGSDYFKTTPTEVTEPVDTPDDTELTQPIDDVDEYERWAAEQRAKYSKGATMSVSELAVAVSHDEMMPMDGQVEAPALTAQQQEEFLQRPTTYRPEERMSTSPELTEKVNEITSEDYSHDQPLAAQMDWNALEGSSIRQVLQKWSSSANVELMWLSDNDFAVLNPFIMRSTYERAVQKMLDQYQDNQVRPVATLHIDPETNVKTLVVRVVGGQ